MERGGCGCLLVSTAALLGGLLLGAPALYSAARNPAPVRVSCAWYAEHRPPGDWVHLAACRPDWIDVVYEQGPYGNVDVLWVPVQPLEEEVPASIVMEVRDRALIAEILEAWRRVDPELADREEAFAPAFADLELTVEGMVTVGWEDNELRRAPLASIRDQLADDVVIIRHQREPSWGLGLGGVGVSFLGVLGLLLVAFVATRSPE